MLQQHRAKVVGAALLLVFLLLYILWPRSSAFQDMSMPELLAAYQAELQSPGMTVEDVAKNLGDADAAYEFVRDEIILSNYAGHVQSPETVLQTRFANSLDKAALLASLLQQMGWTVTHQYHDSYFAPSYAKQKSKPKISPYLAEINKRLGIDSKTFQRNWQETLDRGETYLQQQQEITEAAYKQLQDLIDYNLDYAESSSIRGYGQRIFVKAEREGENKLFDIFTFNEDAPDFYLSYDMPPLQAPIIELRLVQRDGLEQTLLRSTRPLFGHQLGIKFLPTFNMVETLAGPADPTRVDNWTPAFAYDDQLITGTPFAIDGSTPSLKNTPPISNIDDFTLVDPTSAYTIEIARTDLSQWPHVQIALKIDATEDGAWVPAHFNISDNGTPVPSRLMNISQDKQRVLVLTDISWSMGDINAFDVSKQAIIDLISQLPPETEVGLSSFAGGVNRNIPIGPLGDGVAFAEAVNGLEMTSSTGIINALFDASSMEGLDNGVIVLLTDGYDNVGGSERDMIAALQARNIRVFAIALGEDSDSALLQRIAEGTEGSFQKIRTADELQPFYARLGQELTSYVVLEYDATDIEAKPFDMITISSAEEEAASLLTEESEVDGDIIENVTPGDGTPETATSAEMAEGSLEGPVITAEETGLAPESAPEPDPLENDHKIVVAIKDTPLKAVALYAQPLTSDSRPVRLMLHVEYRVNGDYREINRLLLDFTDPELAWKLTGDYRLFEDLDMFPGHSLQSAYIAEWQQAWALKEEKSIERFALPGLDYGQMMMLNGFRALSRYQPLSQDEPIPMARLNKGPNLYLRRSWLSPDNGGVNKQIFDVLYRHYRGDGGARSWDIAAMEMANARAEGLVLEGENGIDALMQQADSLQVINLEGARPKWLPEPLWQEAGNGQGVYDKLIATPENDHYVWQIEEGLRHSFRVLYQGEGIVAKGSNAQRIAQQFDKIDKMLALYEGAVGNFAGLIPTTGAQLSAISSFKREELKLWCYSTIMMGYVGETIEDDSSLLNTDPQAAKANAARLCKINGSPDDGKKLIDGMITKAAEDGVNSFLDNVRKDASGTAASTAESLWSTGGALNNAIFSAAQNKVGTAASPLPMTATFHRAMAERLETSP